MQVQPTYYSALLYFPYFSHHLYLSVGDLAQDWYLMVMLNKADWSLTRGWASMTLRNFGLDVDSPNWAILNVSLLQGMENIWEEHKTSFFIFFERVYQCGRTTTHLTTETKTLWTASNLIPPFDYSAPTWSQGPQRKDCEITCSYPNFSIYWVRHFLFCTQQLQTYKVPSPYILLTLLCSTWWFIPYPSVFWWCLDCGVHLRFDPIITIR